MVTYAPGYEAPPVAPPGAGHKIPHNIPYLWAPIMLVKSLGISMTPIGIFITPTIRLRQPMTNRAHLPEPPTTGSTLGQLQQLLELLQAHRRLRIRRHMVPLVRCLKQSAPAPSAAPAALSAMDSWEFSAFFLEVRRCSCKRSSCYPTV